MLGLIPKLCIIAKKSLLVVNMFVFIVFVWDKFTCAGKKPVDADSVILLRRKEEDFFER